MHSFHTLPPACLHSSFFSTLRLTVILCGWALSLWASAETIPLQAQEMPINIETQTAMFRKIFVFNRTMEGKKVKVLVVYNNASASLVEGVTAGFQAQGIETLAAREDAVERTLKDNKGKIHALYIMPAVLSSFDKLCAEHQILSITGVPTLTRAGKASVALGVRNGKPSIVVHLQQLKGEGQELSASLLQIAQIVQ